MGPASRKRVKSRVVSKATASEALRDTTASSSHTNLLTQRTRTRGSVVSVVRAAGGAWAAQLDLSWREKLLQEPLNIQ